MKTKEIGALYDVEHKHDNPVGSLSMCALTRNAKDSIVVVIE